MRRLALLLPLLALVAGCRTGSFRPSPFALPEERADALAAAIFAAPDETVVHDEILLGSDAGPRPATQFAVVRGQRAAVAVTHPADVPDVLRIDLPEGSTLARRLDAVRALAPDRRTEELRALRADALALAAASGPDAVRRIVRDCVRFDAMNPFARRHARFGFSVAVVESDEPPRAVVVSFRTPPGAVVRVPAGSLLARDLARVVARAAPWDWPDRSAEGESVSAAGQSGVRLWRRAEPLVRGEDGVDRASRAFENLAEDVLRRIALARKAPPETPALRVETVPAPPPDGPDERLSFELEARFLELSAATLEELGLEWLVAWSEQDARLWDNPDGNVRNGCWPPPSAEDIRKRMVVVRHGEAERADDSTFSPPELELVLGSLAGNNLVESYADAWTTVRDGDLVRFAAPGIALDASVCKPGGRKGIAIEPSLAVELDPSAPLVAPPPVALGLYSGSTVAIFLPGGDTGPVRLLLLTVREVGGEPAYSLDRTPVAPADFAALAWLFAAEVRAESPPGEDADELRDDLFPLFQVEPDAPLEDADWKRIFAACGVDWPDGSFVHQMVRAHANFLTVRNTAPALRHVSRVLDALGNDQSRAARLLATLSSGTEDEPHAESAETAE